MVLAGSLVSIWKVLGMRSCFTFSTWSLLFIGTVVLDLSDLVIMVLFCVIFFFKFFIYAVLYINFQYIQLLIGWHMRGCIFVAFSWHFNFFSGKELFQKDLPLNLSSFVSVLWLHYNHTDSLFCIFGIKIFSLLCYLLVHTLHCLKHELRRVRSSVTFRCVLTLSLISIIST